MRHKRGAGSATVVAPDGYLVTNAHVVDGQKSVRVRFADGRRNGAIVIGRDGKVCAVALTTLAMATEIVSAITVANLVMHCPSRLNAWRRVQVVLQAELYPILPFQALAALLLPARFGAACGRRGERIVRPGVARIAAAHFAARVGPVLYCSGEESEHQIKSRGDRLGVGDAPLYLLAETCIERIIEEVTRLRPALLVVDSVQTVFSLKFQSAPGSIGQVRESCLRLMELAKGEGIAVVLVGHVTKEGAIAGPKTLEHLVDAVLTLEGERYQPLRLLRASKNRFGSTDEVGVFEMGEAGLAELSDPARAFLAEDGGGVRLHADRVDVGETLAALLLHLVKVSLANDVAAFHRPMLLGVREEHPGAGVAELAADGAVRRRARA